MRISKKMAAIFLAVVMVVSAIPFTASAVVYNAKTSESRKLEVASLNVGDYVVGAYSGIKYDGRKLVLKANEYSLKVGGVSQANDTDYELEGDYTISNTIISKDNTEIQVGANGWQVLSISNGVVTLGYPTETMPATNGTGTVGNPNSAPITSGGMAGPAIPGFGGGNPIGAYRVTVDGTNLYYSTLEAAVADSLEGETIKLCANIDLSGKYARGNVSYIFYLENRTLDLNGFKISMYNHAVGFSGDNMTIKNGTFECVPTSTNLKLSYALPIYPEIFERQSSSPGDLQSVTDKSTGVVLEDLTLNPGGLNVKGSEVTCKNINVTGHSYYGVSAEWNSVVTIESGSYTTTEGGTTVILTSDKTDSTPKQDDNTQFIIKGGNFNLGSATTMFKSNTNSHYTVMGGTYKTASDAVSVVPVSYIAEKYAQNMETGTVEKTEPINGTSVTVADEISENFYIDEDYYKSQNANQDVYMTVNYNHNSNASEIADFQTETMDMSTLPAVDDATSAYDGARMLSVIQAPAQSTEPITINVYGSESDAENETNPMDTITYSVYDYCRTVITGASYTEEVKDLAKATLDYAAASQVYFDYNTDEMATKDNAGNAFYGDVEDVNLGGVAGFASKPSSISKATVVIKSDLEINLFSTAPMSVTGSNLDTDKGGDRFNVAVEDRDGWSVIHISGIEPANMDNTISLTTNNGVVEFTANTIMKAMASGSDANLATLAKAMYLYGVAANACF